MPTGLLVPNRRGPVGPATLRQSQVDGKSAARAAVEPSWLARHHLFWFQAETQAQVLLFWWKRREATWAKHTNRAPVINGPLQA
jgi:hypothetical protein